MIPAKYQCIPASGSQEKDDVKISCLWYMYL